MRVPDLPLILIVIAGSALGCHRHADPSSAQATAVREVLTRTPAMSFNAQVWIDARKFYDQRQNASAWITGSDSTGAVAALQVLRSAHEHGFAPEDYGEPQLTEQLTLLRQSKVETA